MAELPKSVRVGHRNYAIEDWVLQDAVSEGRYGDCDKMNAKIRVCTGHDVPKTGETLIHELLHACWDAGSLGAKEGEEKTVTVLAKQLAQVIRDNPHLVTYLSESLSS